MMKRSILLLTPIIFLVSATAQDLRMLINNDAPLKGGSLLSNFMDGVVVRLKD